MPRSTLGSWSASPPASRAADPLGRQEATDGSWPPGSSRRMTTLSHVRPGWDVELATETRMTVGRRCRAVGVVGVSNGHVQGRPARCRDRRVPFQRLPRPCRSRASASCRGWPVLAGVLDDSAGGDPRPDPLRAATLAGDRRPLGVIALGDPLPPATSRGRRHHRGIARGGEHARRRGGHRHRAQPAPRPDRGGADALQVRGGDAVAERRDVGAARRSGTPGGRGGAEQGGSIRGVCAESPAGCCGRGVGEG